MKDVGHHPNVVKMLACCTAPGNLMLITEFVPFDNLQNFLHLAKDRKRQVRTWPYAVPIVLNA